MRRRVKAKSSEHEVFGNIAGLVPEFSPNQMF